MNPQDQTLLKPLVEKSLPVLIQKLKTEKRVLIIEILHEAGYSSTELQQINRQQSAYAVHLDFLEKNLFQLFLSELKETHPQISIRFAKRWGADGEIIQL